MTIIKTIINGTLTPGEHVSGTSEGPGWTSHWSGIYIGSWNSDGELYNYFRNGEINGTPQRCFGHPAAQLPGATPVILEIGTLVDMGSPEPCRITEHGAVTVHPTPAGWALEDGEPCYRCPEPSTALVVDSDTGTRYPACTGHTRDAFDAVTS